MSCTSTARVRSSSSQCASGVAVDMDVGVSGVCATAAAYGMQADGSAGKVRIMAGADQRRGVGGRAATNCASVPLSGAENAASSAAERTPGWVGSMCS